MSPFRLTRAPAEPAPAQPEAGTRPGPPGAGAIVVPDGAAEIVLSDFAGEERAPGARMGELLVERNLVTPAQVAEALLQQKVSGRKLGLLLMELGAVAESEVSRVVAEQAGLPMAELRSEEPEPEAINLLPEALARKLCVIPMRRVNGELQIAVCDPFHPQVIEQIRAAVPGNISFVVAPPSEIRRAIDNAYRALADVDQFVATFRATENLRAVVQPDRQDFSDDAPVVQVVNRIITQALRDRASDVHIEPQSDRLRVRFRIDGALHDMVALPENMAAALVSRIKIMAKMNIVDRRRPHDGQMAMDVDGRPIDIRVSTTPTIWGEKAVLRILDRNRTLFQLDDLGMPADGHDIYSRLVRSPYGMVLCAGPTGSGKTTTLYATLTEINHSERNVTTIEDPVEYLFNSINQMQINEQAGLTFAEGLRSILRQDPDVILVGEIRDAETAHIAVESALTGHLVLSSMHATDACSTLERFLDMGIEPFLVATTVIGVVSQRLIRRTCRNCRVAHQPSIEELAFYRQAGGDPAKTGFWQGEGCNFCARTGYQDRTGVFEVLQVTEEVKRALLDRAGTEGLRQVAVAQGMRRLIDEGVRLVTEDVTTISEVMRSLYTL